MNKGEKSSRFETALNRTVALFFPFLLFALAFLPRAIYLVARSTLWFFRAIEFTQAISERDWGATFLAPHPGVTTMWLSGIAYQLGKVLVPDLARQHLHQQMAVTALPLVLVISLSIVGAYFLLSRIFDRQVACVVSLLLALDPFHILISKTIQVDALMSVFMMLSALWMLAYVASDRQGRWFYIGMSGLFAGLALLSKLSIA